MISSRVKQPMKKSKKSGIRRSIPSNRKLRRAQQGAAPPQEELHHVAKHKGTLSRREQWRQQVPMNIELSKRLAAVYERKELAMSKKHKRSAAKRMRTEERNAARLAKRLAQGQ